MDPVTMMVASIGMQFFNNYANNEKNDEIQAQQREFQIAAAEHDFERMRKAQATAAKLALELEAEIHKERVEDIEKSYDTLLDNFANSFAITDWPLNVLPFIMKGESFGTLFGGTAKPISMHCILTPSNCAWFNEYFYDDLDFRVEAEMNNTWNAQSTHPIVYYGGGWNRRQNNLNGGTFPALIDLDDIALLKNKLKQIPTMVITPYFDPYLHFRVQLWGMGKDANTPFRIDVPQGEIASSSRIFSYDYKKANNTPELTDDFFNTTMEEFVPYLTCLIGFVADKYFWSMYGYLPILPKYLLNNKNGLVVEKLLPSYITKYETEVEVGNLIIRQGNVAVGDYAGYIKSLNQLLPNKSIEEKIKKLLTSYCYKYAKSEDLMYLDTACERRVIPKSDIEHLLMCLDALKQTIETDKLTKKICNLKKEVDQVFFCYHMHEVLSMISESIGNGQYANLKTVDSHVIFVAVYGLNTMLSFNVYVVHKDNKSIGNTYRLNKNSIKAVRIKTDPFLEKIPLNILPLSAQDELIKYNKLFRNMINLYSQVQSVYPSIFDCVKKHKISYKEIVNWSYDNYKQGDSLTIMRLLHDDFFFVVGYLAPSDRPSLERCIIAKSYSLDKSIIEIMNDKTVFIQQFK